MVMVTETWDRGRAPGVCSPAGRSCWVLC